MPSLQHKLNAKTLVLQGVLDENADLKSLPPHAQWDCVNFKDVQRINSCGVRDWVLLLQARAGQPLAYEACPIAIVRQINSVPEFSKGIVIRSLFAPYFCEACDEERLILIDPATVQNRQPPAVPCATCKAPLKFDAIPNQFFQFL